MWLTLTRWPELALRLVSAPPGMPADDDLPPTTAEQLGRAVCLLEDIRNHLAQGPTEHAMSLTDEQLDDFQDRLEAAGVPAPFPAIIRETIADLFAPKPFGVLRPVPNPQK